MVHTCLNMVQTCMYMFMNLCTCMRMYIHVHEYILMYVACTYMYMNFYICMWMIHTWSWIYIVVCTYYRHCDGCTVTVSQPHFISHQALSALRRWRVSAPRGRLRSFRAGSFLSCTMYIHCLYMDILCIYMYIRCTLVLHYTTTIYDTKNSYVQPLW